MVEIAQSIDLNIAEKLRRDAGYRQQFFLAEASATIARQLVALRKRRGLDQKQLADLIGTQQPGISRVEKADYQNWSFNTLRKLAAALDARIQVRILASEDVLAEYDAAPSEGAATPSPTYQILLNPPNAQACTISLGIGYVSMLAAPTNFIVYSNDPNDASINYHFGSLSQGANRYLMPTALEQAVGGTSINEGTDVRDTIIAQQAAIIRERDAEIERLKDGMLLPGAGDTSEQTEGRWTIRSTPAKWSAGQKSASLVNR